MSDANAAQIAARKIKSAKSVKGKGPVNRNSSVKSNLDSSVPLFADPEQTQMQFGGQLAAASFNFTSNVPTINFGNTSGSTTPAWGANGGGSDTEQDPRADTTGEEAARRNRPFQIDFGGVGAGAANSLPQQSSNLFQRTPLSSLGQPNGMSPVPEDKPANPFQMARSQSPAQAPTFNFGQTTQSFGQTAQQQQPASNPFSFGQATQAAPPAQNSTPFRFGTPDPAQQQQQQQPTTSIFSFGQNSTQAQPASTGMSFGNTQASTNGTTPTFFGQNPTQPPSSSMNFTAGSAFSQPSGNLFGQVAQQPSSSAMEVESTPAWSPTKSSFGQSATAASTPSNSIFGNLNQQSTNSQNFFPNATSQTNHSSNIFGAQNQQPTPSSQSIFGAQSSAPTSNLFGGNTHKNATSGNMFETSHQTPATSTNMFGAPQQQQQQEQQQQQPQQQNTSSAPPTNLFGTPKPSGSIFGAQQSGTTSNIFANKATEPATSSIFGNQAQKSSAPTSLFGHLNQPTPQVTNGNNGEANSATTAQSQNGNSDVANATNATASTQNGFGLFNNGSTNLVPPPSPKPAPATLSPAKPATTNNIFGQKPFGNGIAATQEPVSHFLCYISTFYLLIKMCQVSILPSIEVENTPAQNNSFAPTTSNLFSSMKPVDAPDAASQPAPSGMFPSLSQSIPTQPSSTNIFAKANMSQTSSASTQASSQATANGTLPEPSRELQQLQEYISEIGEVDDSVVEAACPAYFNAEQKIQFYAAYRVRSLNKGVQDHLARSHIGSDMSAVFYHYITRREEILEACKTGINNLKRKRGELEEPESSVNKRSKPSEIRAVEHAPRTSSPLKTQPVVDSSNAARPKSPEKRPQSGPMRPKSPVKSQPSINGSTTPKVPPPSRPLFGEQIIPPPSPTPRGKRKAEVQITKDNLGDEDEENQSNNSSNTNGKSASSATSMFVEQAATPRGKRKAEVQITKDNPDEETGENLNNKRSAPSATSSVFKSILDKPGETTAASGSPEKRMFSMNKTPDKPRANPFANLPMPGGSPAAVAASPTKPSVFGSASVPKPAESSTSIFGAKSASNAAARNPFAPKEGASTSTLFSPKPAGSSTSIFGAKSATNTAAPNPFTAKPTSTATESASSSDGKEKVLKPPTFGSLKPPTFGSAAPVNFLAQFGQKSEKSMSDSEAEAMEKAKLEDLDSEDDEAEWEANYKAKREAEKKAREEQAKNKKATFVPGKGFTFAPVEAMSDKTQSTPKSIFSQTSAPISSLNMFAPVNTPGSAQSSRASSVFDGVQPGKPVSFSGSNIFGHLSDVDSGADSGKGNDADDDTSDGEDTDSGLERDGDDEKKDATYEPSSDNAPGTPGTPPEETGPGIASAKKPANPFTIGASSTSGTSTPGTPGGSLFDRISKDSNGNPIRQLPSENKENAAPKAPSAASLFGGSPTNIFAFGKKSTAEQNKSAQDNTWKQDSPIKFGASPPSVSVTAPTPTKANPFASLLGSTGSPTPTGSPFQGFGTTSAPKPSSPAPATSPFAGLFGNTTAPKPATSLFANLGNTENKAPAVGFNFGATSTTTSSLFPSAAGSTATSRATSPGGTTDGESAADTNGDPDAERHEQIDLTKGGAGEENEDVLHQVRTKALKFEASKEDPKKNEWVVKGLGPLRVLKHKETGSCRILLRADPSGTIVLNKGILGNVTYESSGKTLKLLTAGEGGQSLETWLLQVKTPESAKELAEVLDKNKRKD
jgi:hypothetical protein